MLSQVFLSALLFIITTIQEDCEAGKLLEAPGRPGFSFGHREVNKLVLDLI